MKKQDILYKQTLTRVGIDNMQGINRLIDDGYHGLAEKQTVNKLFMYVKTLEKKLNIDIPDPEKGPAREGQIKINQGGISYFVPSASGISA